MKLINITIRPLGDYAAFILNLDWENAPQPEQDALCKKLAGFLKREGVNVISLAHDGSWIRMMIHDS